jgi:hypothetical protein
MGSSKPTIIQPTPAPQPTMQGTAEDYAKSLPVIYEQQLKYAPLEAQQQLELAQQYALPLADVYKQANQALYPETAAIQEQLSQQAMAGSNAEVPDWMRQQYTSDMNAQLGSNVNAPIGADYMSRGLLQQRFDYNNYYRNLGLSLAERQPLAAPTSPNYTNQMGGYNMGNAMNFTSGNYGAYTNAARPFQAQNETPTWMKGMDAFGNLLQGFGSMKPQSSVSYKENVVDNVIDSVGIIKKLNIVNFRYRREFGDSKTHIGVIAEECPDVITSNGKKTIELMDICGLLLDAVKKLTQRIETIEAKIA